MPAAADLIASLRAELAPLSAKIRDHPYLASLASAAIPRDRLGLFAGEQYHIIKNDMRSFALLLSRQHDDELLRFLMGSVSYEAAAFEALFDFAAALGLTEADLQAYEPLAGAHAYTAFLALTAAYGAAAEMAAAFIIDLEGWGGNCRSISRSLKERYGFDALQVRFFDHFGAEDPEFEPRSLAVVATGLASGDDPRTIRRTARLMLEYELMFWDALYQASIRQ